jgi:hypothetical protein
VLLFVLPLICVFGTIGYRLLQTAKKPYQHLSFQFNKSGRNVRRDVAKLLKSLFRNTIKQVYGGWISRLNTGEAMHGVYEVHLFSRSHDLTDDPKFTELWNFMVDVLDVDFDTVETALMTTHEADPQFKSKFVLDFKHESPPDWSDRPDIDSDADSVFSIESVVELI